MRGREVTRKNKNGATVFACRVSHPERYGVPEFDKNGKVISIIEKPLNPKSAYAITGLYFYDGEVVNMVKKLKPSRRGELEITDLNEIYLKQKKLNVLLMSRGMTWFDTGNFESLFNASSYVKALQERQGLRIGSPEEVAWRKGWISDKEIKKLGKLFDNSYGDYLSNLIES